MKKPGQPLFLARRSYRQRRLIDALRLLPFVTIFLFCLPVLWHSGAAGPATVRGGIYLFLSWLAMILVAALLLRQVRRGAAEIDGKDGEEDGPARAPLRPAGGAGG